MVLVLLYWVSGSRFLIDGPNALTSDVTHGLFIAKINPASDFWLNGPLPSCW